MAKAEVSKLAGAPAEAAASLRIYQDRHAGPLADQARAALASLPAEPA